MYGLASLRGPNERIYVIFLRTKISYATVLRNIATLQKKKKKSFKILNFAH